MKWMSELDPNQGKTVAWLIGKLKEVPELCGVYFLFESDVVVYVGSSVNISARINSHLSDRSPSRKSFSCAKYLEISEEELIEAERFFINYFSPKYNRSKHAIGRKKPVK